MSMFNSDLSLFDENQGVIAGFHREGSVVCPKPRRAVKTPIRILRLEEEDELGFLEFHMASPPPFFCGSPPSRAGNPLVHDVRFEDLQKAQGSAGVSASVVGYGRLNFGVKPAAVRVEGFDCINRDRQSSSIPAMA